MVFSDRHYLRGLARLAWINLKHYAFALWGAGRLDPDYPIETRFLGHLVIDAVLEYRAYALFAPWALFLAAAGPIPALELIAAYWAVLAWHRAYFFTSAFRFWRQAYAESPSKMRTRTRYAEELIREIERRMKAGTEYQELIEIAMKIQNEIIERKP